MVDVFVKINLFFFHDNQYQERHQIQSCNNDEEISMTQKCFLGTKIGEADMLGIEGREDLEAKKDAQVHADRGT